jgi:hypothetical protein
MPAGNVQRAKLCAEDDGCAESIRALLAGEPVDVPSVIALCRVDARILERREREPDLGADIEICFDLDAVPVVPRVVDVASSSWFAVTPAPR